MVTILDRTPLEHAEFMPLWNLSGFLMRYLGPPLLSALGAWIEPQKL